ncbi:MAG: alkaline phosphatase PhoX [Pyrinomonadaceae bacterium]
MRGRVGARARGGGYGPLRPLKSRNTGETFLALPEGYEYNVIGRAGARMSDGCQTPKAHDGMAAFKVGSELRLVRNHEINNGTGAAGAALGKKTTTRRRGDFRAARRVLTRLRPHLFHFDQRRR